MPVQPIAALQALHSFTSPNDGRIATPGLGTRRGLQSAWYTRERIFPVAGS